MKPSANPVIEALLSRRSAKAVSLPAPAPSPDQLDAILNATAYAPDHGLLVPFRFLEVEAHSRPQFAEIIAASTLALHPDASPALLERDREKATQGAMLLVMIGKIDDDHPKIIASDQWLAIGCALENFLISAQALGFGVAIRSGAYLNAAPMREGLRLAPKEQAVALLAIGTAKEWPPAKPKPSVEQIFSRWEA